MFAGRAEVKTEVVQQDGGWALLRGGQLYEIKGVRGSWSPQLLKRMGGNFVRTWGADEGLGKQLDEAQRLGISVTVGIWLAQERDSYFDFHNPANLQKQADRVRATILKYKDHPAVLMWGVGNEVEGYGEGDNVAIWSAVEQLAKLAKQIDPNHPTMTAIAEIGGAGSTKSSSSAPISMWWASTRTSDARRCRRGARLLAGSSRTCSPSSARSVRGRRENPFGALIETTSSAKAAMYLNSYTQAIASQPGLTYGYRHNYFLEAPFLPMNAPIDTTNADDPPDTAAGYSIRWRHGHNDTANFLFADGHAGSFRLKINVSSDAKLLNFYVNYQH